MATTTNRKRNTTKKNTSTGKRSTTKNNSSSRKMSEEDLLIINYVVIIGSILLCVLLFLCNFGLVGSAGDFVSKIMFGLFGKMAYIFPVFLIVMSFLWISKQSDSRLVAKLVAFGVLFVSISIFFEVSEGYTSNHDIYSIKDLFLESSGYNVGGGVISGSVGYFLNRYIGKIATLLIVVFLIFVCCIVGV